MTLKEKFLEVDIDMNDSIVWCMSKIEAEECEKIADDYAISFAEWKEDNTLRVELDEYKVFGDSRNQKTHTIKELLEIFKKERGL
jgi:hypothetical protein